MIYTMKLIIENLENDNDIILEEMLNTNEYNIVFGKIEYFEESVPVFDKNGSISVVIRNRIRDGRNGQPIQHPECTVKLVKDSYPRYKGSKGIPFTIDPIKLHKHADNNNNRKAIKNRDLKFLKEVIADNKDDILNYWNTDPNTEEGKKTLDDIEKRIKNKYMKK